MFNNITRREKTLAVITLLAALTAVGFNFIIKPLAGRWNSLENDIREKKFLLKKHSRMLRDKEKIKKLHAKYTKYLKTKKLTSEIESAEALSNIERLARSANVRITNIKPLAPKSFDSYDKFTFRVATESNLQQLTRFIYDLQASEQLLKVERMVLRTKERKPDVIKGILHITKLSLFQESPAD